VYVKSLLALPHWPILLYLAAALILAVGGRRISSRLRNVLGVGVCVAVGGMLVYIRGSVPIDVVFSDWLVHLTLLGSLIYHVDYLNWTFAAMLTLVVAAKLAWTALNADPVQRPGPGERVQRSGLGDSVQQPGLGNSVQQPGLGDRDARLVPGLLLLSAAGYSILFAGNVLTLLLSWTVLMAASLVLLALGRSGTVAARRYLVLFGAGALFLLWATWDAGRGDGGRWASLALSQPSVLALFIAAWISLSAYPLHVWLPLEEGIWDDILALLQIVPALIGLYLLARLSLIVSGRLLFQDTWLALGAVSLLMGAELAWVQRRKSRALACVAVALGGALILGASFPPAYSLYVILPWAMTLPPALLVLALTPPRAGMDDPEWLDYFLRIVTGLACAALIGLPPMAGFVVWSRLESAVHSLGSPVVVTLLIALLAVSGGLIAAALFRFWLVPRPAGRIRAGWQCGVLSVVLLLPTLLVAVRPRWAVVRMVGPSLTTTLNLTDVALTPGLWVTVLPVALGFALTVAWLRGWIDLSASMWDRLERVWRLDWACRWLETFGRWLAAIVETATDLIHGDHHLVWAFLVVLVFMWFYLFP
jgi:formate hydrogenlyase subunit 3/multisubunit Na+/H+ antiporter MnhD subunit